MSAPILNVQGLTVSFGDAAPVVEAVDFQLHRGETLAIVGESGSGKSVTALSLAGLLPESASVSGVAQFGEVELIGAETDTLRQIRGNDISYIFQEPMTSLNPLHTVEKQIAESLKLHQHLSGSKIRERIIELLGQVGIQDPQSRLKSYPHELSGGQRQRVMIAMALANKPELLVADEPTTALDVTIQAQILELLEKVQEDEGMAMIFITHDLTIVRRFADRVVVMKDGRIVEAGVTEDVFDNPRHEMTRALLSAEPSGRPDPAPPGSAEVARAEAMKVWFPIKAGVLRHTVGHIKALNRADFVVHAGETLGIVGESGSGKTTAALGFLRLISSTGGLFLQRRAINGLNQRELRPLRCDMQIVFQDPYGSLSPRMTVGQIIGEGLEVHHRFTAEKAHEEVARVLQEVGLSPSITDRYPHEFSGGQRQRIAIARAMILKPKLLVLDEPTSALDRTVQGQIIDLLRDLQARHGLAYIFISHDLKVVRALCHRVMVLRHGDVVEEGPADQIFDSPQTDYTRALMAAAFDVRAIKGAGV